MFDVDRNDDDDDANIQLTNTQSVNAAEVDVTPASKPSAVITSDDYLSVSRNSESSSGCDKTTDSQRAETPNQWQSDETRVVDLDLAGSSSENFVFDAQTRNCDDACNESLSTDDHRRPAVCETGRDDYAASPAAGDNDSTYGRNFSRLSSVHEDSGWDAVSANDDVTVSNPRVTLSEPLTSDRSQECDKTGSVTTEAATEHHEYSPDIWRMEDAKEVRNFHTANVYEPRENASYTDAKLPVSACGNLGDRGIFD